MSHASSSWPSRTTYFVERKDVDGRDEPGHDVESIWFGRRNYFFCGGPFGAGRGGVGGASALSGSRFQV
jgi:hypothetical protein